MSELALRLIEENKKTQDPFLDLGNCGLINELPKELLDCVWLKGLNLGVGHNEKGQWIKSKNNGKRNKFQGNKLAILKNLTQLQSLYLRSSQIQDISFLQNLTQLHSLDLNSNQIQDSSFLQNLKQLRLLDINSNPIEDYSFLEHIIQLRIFSITINKSDDIIFLQKLTQLQSLNISSTKINDFGFLANFTQLKCLYLGFSRLIDYNFLKNLTQLETLDLSYNEIQDISFLKKLKKLQDLNLWKNQISDISYLKSLNELQTLNLGFNKIKDISSLKNLSKLTNLELFSNQIIDISCLKNKIQLQFLDLSSNEITNASFLENLTGLSFLNVFSNKIRDISFLENLTQLQHLELSFNEIQDFSYLKNLTELQYLDLQYNSITDISFLEKLTHLQELNLSSNKIQNISFLKKSIKLQSLKINKLEIQDINFLRNLNQLQTLEINNNKIQDISFLGDLPQLQTLEINNNQIQDISSLSNLKQLRALDLSNNQIQDYSSLKKLVLLKSLRLRNNEIKNISFLENLIQLEHLDIRNNSINSAKSLLRLLKKGLKIDLKTDYETYHRQEEGLIFLKDNLINEPSFEILEQGNDKIIEYFEGKRKSLNECKLIFVGDGKAGKTSLMRKLVFNDFNPKEPTTHGINKIAWKDIKNEKGEEIKVNLWDFGGQHIQHSLHQFFFTERVIYVLVLDPRNDSKANYWLDQIEKLGCNSEILIAYNWKQQEDKQADFLSNFYELRKKYPKLPEPFLLSCLTGEGVEAFKKVLIKSILNSEDLNTEYLVSWFNIKQRLEKEVSVGKNYITYETYQEWCNEEDYKEPERQKSLLRILDSIGSIVFFDKPILAQLQVLNPEWLTTGAYAILVSEQNRVNKGHLSWSDLKEIFKKPKEIFSDKTIRITYTESQFSFIIELMIQYDLCHRKPSPANEFLIPSAFGDKPDKDYSFAKENAQWYRLQFESPFEMLIMHRFITKNLLKITGKDYWQSGIYIKHPDSETYALIETNLYSKRIDCWIKGYNVRGFWEMIRGDFREILSIYNNFTYKEEVLYKKDGREFFLPYDEMLKAYKKGLNIIPYHPTYDIENIEVLAVLELFENKNQTQKNMENEKKGDTNYIFNAPINGDIGNIGNDSNSTFNKGNHNKSEAKKEESKEEKITEDKAVRRWKMVAIWSFLIALFITIPILYIYTNEPKILMTEEEWKKFKGSFINVISGLAFTGGWVYFIYKMLYERLLDSSKEKSFRDLWKSKK